MRSIIPFRRALPLVLVAGAMAALGSCDDTTSPVGGDGPDDPDPDPDPTVTECGWISLSADAAIPTEPVAIGVLPDSFDTSTWVETRAPGDSTPGYVWLEAGDDGAATMPAPVHPLGDPDGGAVELTVTDGTHTCAPISFTIEALPEAPGTYAALVDSLDAALAVQAGIMGTTPAALATASFDTLPDQLLPLALTQAVVSHPDNPSSMAALAAGTSAVAGEADLTLADRLLARTGAPESVSTFLAALRERAATVPAAGDRSGAAGVPMAQTAAEHDCLGVETAYELNWCMERARVAINALQGASGQVLSDAGTGFGVTALIPPVKGVSEAIGSVIGAAELYFQAAAGLLPSELNDLTFEITRDGFMEDEDGSGEWQNAMISASSAGWNLDDQIVQTILEKAELPDAFGEVAQRAANVHGTALGDLLGFLVADRVSNAISERTGDPNGAIEIPPETFGPVPVDDEEWTDSNVDASGVLALTSRTTYEPREPGTGEVILETVEGKFGGQQRSARLPVEIGRIAVVIDPDVARADPGETLPFFVAVENAAYPERLEVTADQGAIESVTYEGGGLHTVSYTAPSQTEFQDFITVVDTATTGTLAYTGNRPLAQADITSKAELVVEPIAACLEEVGDDTTFTATVVGLEDTSVTWAVVKGPGTVDGSGTYTATEPGSAVLEATAVADTTLKGSVQVTIGGCDCWWAVQVSGVPPFGSGVSDDSWLITYAVSGGELTSIGLYGDASSGDHGDLTVYPGSQMTGVPLAPGTYDGQALGSYSSGSALTHQYSSNDSVPPLTVSLVEADSSRVQGDVSGVLLLDSTPIDGQGISVVNVQATFRITPNVTQELAPGVTAFHCEWPW